MQAGCDEAGRGPIAGPVVAAVVIPPQDLSKFEGVSDSKALTAAERTRLAPIIKQEAIAWAIGIANVEEIEQYNIVQATFLAMHRAVRKVLKQHLITELLVDGNSFRPYPGLAHVCIVKGDAKEISIGAASILAKTYRDDLMCQLAKEYPLYQWASNKGYPTAAHRKAVKAYGPTPHHRATFTLF